MKVGLYNPTFFFSLRRLLRRWNESFAPSNAGIQNG